MEKYNPDIHHRRSIRLKGYDYSQAGLYFVTICTQNRECLFGNVENKKMILNDAGKIIEKWYYKLENKFSNIKCQTMIVMPNHFHAILEIIPADDVRKTPRALTNNNDDIRADPCVCPNNITDENNNKGEQVGLPLHVMVQWFKTMTTNEYIRGVKNHNWKRFNGKLWQRNYWEHIIRNYKSYNIISDYIIHNPIKWEKDKFSNSNKLTI